jgi:hypothetical protein
MQLRTRPWAEITGLPKKGKWVLRMRQSVLRRRTGVIVLPTGLRVSQVPIVLLKWRSRRLLVKRPVGQLLWRRVGANLPSPVLILRHPLWILRLKARRAQWMEVLLLMSLKRWCIRKLAQSRMEMLL